MVDYPADMNALPLVNSWGQLGLIVIGIFISLKYLLPLLHKNGNDFGEWRGKLMQILETQTKTLESMTLAIQKMTELLHRVLEKYDPK